MTDQAPDFDNGDVISHGLADAVIHSFRVTAAMTKGDIVALTTTSPTVKTDLGDIQLAAVFGDYATASTEVQSCIGVVCTAQSAQTAYASGDYAPVLVYGVTKLTASAAAIKAGTHVCVAAASTGAFTIKVMPLGAAT